MLKHCNTASTMSSPLSSSLQVVAVTSLPRPLWQLLLNCTCAMSACSSINLVITDSDSMTVFLCWHSGQPFHEIKMYPIRCATTPCFCQYAYNWKSTITHYRYSAVFGLDKLVLLLFLHGSSPPLIFVPTVLLGFDKTLHCINTGSHAIKVSTFIHSCCLDC